MATYYELPTRMDTLLAGAMLALLARGPDSQRWLDKNRLRWSLWVQCAVIALLLVITKGALGFCPGYSKLGRRL